MGVRELSTDRWVRPLAWATLVANVVLVVTGGAVRLTGSDGPGGRTRLLFVHPDSHEKREVITWWGGRPRENETIRLSYDEGKTWPLAKSIEPGRAGYADIAVGKDGMIYCLYERGYVDGNQLNERYFTCARFNLEWLTDGRDSLER